MKINNIVVTFWFNKIVDIENKINYFETELSEYFHIIKSIGVSPSVTPEYPRLTATSDGGHTKLNVSMINLQLATSFDANFNNNYSECFNYIRQRVLKVYNLLTKELNINVLYSAILVLCEVDDSNPLNLIKQNLLSEKLDGNYCDIGVKIAEVVDEKYYRNFSFNTTKQITLKKKIDSNNSKIIFPLLSLTNAVVEKEGIVVNYEINDKYLFDTKENYSINSENLNSMLKIAEKDISDEILRKINK